jgi:methionyl-tRNA synthetase
MREIMKLADKANQYIDEHKPWQLVKEEGKEAQVPSMRDISGLNLLILCLVSGCLMSCQFNESMFKNKVVNIASRSAGFIVKKFDKTLSAYAVESQLYQKFVDQGEQIAKLYEARNYSQAMREIMKLADKANQYIDEHKPWQLVKEEGKGDISGLNLLILCLASGCLMSCQFNESMFKKTSTCSAITGNTGFK